MSKFKKSKEKTNNLNFEAKVEGQGFPGDRLDPR